MSRGRVVMVGVAIGIALGAAMFSAPHAGASTRAARSAQAARPASSARSPQAVRRELQALYTRATAAYLKRDIEGFMAVRAPDFVARAHTGTVVPRDEIVASLQVGFSRIFSIDYIRPVVGSVRVHGDTAVVMVTQDFSRVVLDPRGRHRQVITRGLQHRDTWTRVPMGGWTMRMAEEVSRGTETVDGKPHMLH